MPLPSSSCSSRSAHLPFTKMHGLGNDFVMLSQAPANSLLEIAEWAKRLCDRHFGIGADGLIFPAKPTDPNTADVRFVYYNNDGTQAEMCGNGIRCFARYLADNAEAHPEILSSSALHALTTGQLLRVETDAGLLQIRLNPDQTVTVNMGPPVLDPPQIPFCGKSTTLQVLGQSIPVHPVSMGNPHCIIFQQDLPQALDPAVFGPAVEVHPAFPAKTNVEFVTVTDAQTVDIVVWERGCGFTLACGTGACATAVAAQQLGKVGSHVQANLPGGPMWIDWSGLATDPVWMTGPATIVFKGDWKL